MSTPSIKPISAVLGWFPTTPATEREVLDMATSRQIALRTRLRHTYWLTDCKPLSEVTIGIHRRKMALIDQKDEMSEPEVAELLSDHYGFALVTDEAGEVLGWGIPELQAVRQHAAASISASRERMSELGKRSAAARAVRSEPPRAPAAPSGSGPTGTADDDF